MKLTKNNLEKMVKEVLRESTEQPFFAQLPDEQTTKSAIESNKHSTGPIIRFYENEELDEELDEEVDEVSAVEEGTASAFGSDINIDEIVQEEIAKYLKKKVISRQ